MIVLSVDLATNRAALFGFPRNLIDVPLAPEDTASFPNHRYPDLLNSLYVYAMGHPKQFPGGTGRGFRAVTGAIQELIAQPLDGFAVVSLVGFAALVDALGGLWINPTERVQDSHYPLEDGSGYVHIDIHTGCQLLSGRMALAYARSRHQDSDYGRMRRQAAVLLALRRQVDPLAILERASELLDIAKGNLRIGIDSAELPALADLASQVTANRIKSVRFAPPTYAETLTSSEINAIRAKVADIFVVPPPSPIFTPAPSPSGAPAPSCPPAQ
jgi:LCP family protein required for cell wall assembly